MEGDLLEGGLTDNDDVDLTGDGLTEDEVDLTGGGLTEDEVDSAGDGLTEDEVNLLTSDPVSPSEVIQPAAECSPSS